MKAAWRLSGFPVLNSGEAKTFVNIFRRNVCGRQRILTQNVG